MTVFFVRWDCTSTRLSGLVKGPEEEQGGLGWRDMVNTKLVLASGAIWIMAVGLGVIEPTLANHLHSYVHLTNSAAVGAVFAIPSGAYMAACFLAALLAEKFGNEHVIMAGLGGIGVVLLLFGAVSGVS
eukprot:TRINITY_DN11699_c0_g1_i1.p1 TRINITY_DN11699_c0_g1~~TRINITY_DN11699_c0_g1_i1.p1  ORF type:complete len:129 (-),score=25.82 TRINITY_DN11699_c0_g1_i1:59-445(-)